MILPRTSVDRPAPSSTHNFACPRSISSATTQIRDQVGRRRVLRLQPPLPISALQLIDDQARASSLSVALERQGGSARDSGGETRKPPLGPLVDCPEVTITIEKTSSLHAL